MSIGSVGQPGRNVGVYDIPNAGSIAVAPADGDKGYSFRGNLERRLYLDLPQQASGVAHNSVEVRDTDSRSVATLSNVQYRPGYHPGSFFIDPAANSAAIGTKISYHA